MSKGTSKVIRLPTPRKVILIKRSPNKLTRYERSSIEAAFPGEKLSFVRMDPAASDATLAPWYQHLNYCKEILDRERDVVVLPSSTDQAQWAGMVLMAVGQGYKHLFFGQDLELRRLKGVTLESEKYSSDH